MYSIKKLMESPSAMSRFKAQSGFKLSNASTSSSFILINKLQRILRKEMTAELFDELKLRYFSKNTEVRREIFLDRMVSKLNILDNETLKYMLDVYTDSGFVALVDTMKLSQAKLAKLMPKKAERVDEETIDDDDFDKSIVDKIQGSPEKEILKAMKKVFQK